MKTTSGFTLLEMSIALVVIGLLVLGGIGLMSGVSDTSRYKSTQNNINEIKDALQSYYLLNYRLPCPDTSTPPDGVAEVTCATGASLRGFLPHLTLGIGGAGDAWGERFKYVVSPKFVLPVASPPTLCYSNMRDSVTGKVLINDLVTPLSSANPLIDFAAFAVLSTGKNGRQTNAGMSAAFSNDGGCLSLNERERDNCNTDSILRYGTAMTDGNSVVFDDLVTWIGDMQLVSLLRQTGACDVATESTGFDPSKPTDTDFETGATVFNEDFNGNDSVSTSNGNDKVVIRGDVKKTLDLKDGNNTLLIYGDVKSDGLIRAGNGDDIVRIKGSLYNSIYLNGGNDQLEVEGNVDLNQNTEKVDMGAGDDQIRIYGDVRDTDFELGSGTNTIYIGGSITRKTKIRSTGGTAILYYNAASKPSSSILTLGTGVTIKCKINNAWTNCP